MKVKVGLLLVLIGAILPGVLLAQGTSHLVYGSLVRNEGDLVPDECLHFWAYRVNAPSETLFNYSPGCGYTGGNWYIQVGNFSTWNVGETLRVIFADSCILERAGINVVLSDEASQEYGERVVLYPIGGVRPVLSNGTVAPLSGFVTTGFNYYVLYTHAGRVPPRSVKVTVDGTQYTLIPDPDSLFLDYQIGCWFRTASPITGLRKGVTHTYYFSATDEYGNFATGDIFVHYGPEVYNTPPRINYVNVAPLAASELDTIRVFVSVSDDDGDPVFVSYQWYNQRGIIEGATDPFITGEYFSKHDEVYCYVSVFDGEELGDEGYSPTAVIWNSRPTAPSVRIAPQPAFDNDTLTIEILTPSIDIDGDEIEYLYEWYVNGFLVSTEPTLLPDQFESNDMVECVVLATDNDGGYSDDAVAVTLISMPYLASAGFDPSSGTARTRFNFFVTYVNARNIPPREVFVSIDGILYELEQANPADEDYTDGAVFTGAFSLRRGEHRVSFSATDANGNIARGIDEFAGPVVLNSAPEIYEVYLVPATGERFVVGVPIIVRVGSIYDPDDDPVMLMYKWYRNGERLAVGSDRLDPFYFSTGDTIWCEVYPFDGMHWGTYLTTPPVIIGNTPPTAPVVRILPDRPNTFNTLELVFTSYAGDVDGDTIRYFYHWYRNGEYLPVLDEPFVPEEFTEKNDIWRCYVIYTDGVYIDSVYTEVRIYNYPPVLEELPPGIAVEGVVYDIVIRAYEPDHEDFWGVLVDGPEGLRLEGLRLIWENPVVGRRPYLVRFFLTDGESQTEIFTFELVVKQRTDPLFAPLNLVAGSGYYSVVPLSWNSPEVFSALPYLRFNLRGYIVERGNSPETFERIAFVADTRYLDVGLEPGRAYFYRVIAQYEDFLSIYSNVVSAVPGEASGYLYSNFNYGSNPIIDGQIRENEWNAASRYVFGSYTIYLMNTNEALFIAVVDGTDRLLGVGDEVLISIDDNHSGSWPLSEGSNEGEYRLTFAGESAIFTFQRIWYMGGVYRSDAMPVNAGAGAIGSFEGGVAYEIALRLDENPEFFDAIQRLPGNEIGFRLAVNNSSLPGWEFVFPPLSSIDDPATFGTVFLSMGGYSAVYVEPERIDVEVELNTVACFPLVLRNVGTAPLSFHITEDYRPAGGGPLYNPERVKVLVLTDMAEPSMRWVLDYLGYQGDIVTAVVSFLSALRAESYDIVAVVLRGQLAVENGLWDAVRQFISAGGRAIIATPDIESYSSNELWSSIGVEFVSDLAGRRSAVSWVNSHHPIFSVPFIVPALPRLVSTGEDMGDAMRVISALPLAKFDILPEPENVAIAISPDSRVIVNSFALDGFTDRNSDGINDLAQLLVNELRFVAPVYGLPWVYEEPSEGVVPVNGSFIVDVCFNAEALLPNQTYSGYITVWTNAPDMRFVNIPVSLTTRLPEIHTLSMWFDSELYTAYPGQRFTVPIYINDCSGWNITSLDIKLNLRGMGFGFEGVSLNRTSGPASGWSTPNILEHTRDSFRFRISGTTPLAGSGVLVYLHLYAENTATVGYSSVLSIQPVPGLNPGADVDNYSLGSTTLRVTSGVSAWYLRIVATYDGIVDTLRIGLRPDATALFDPEFDVELSGEDTLRTYILSSDALHPRLVVDIRSGADDYGDGINWYIRTRGRGGKLEWFFEDGENIMRIGSLFLNSRLDMKRSNVYFFSSGEELVIRYRSDGKVPFWFHVYPGFNMVSIPIRLEYSSVSAVFPDTIEIVQRAYRYDTRERRWVNVNTVEPGIGYAVLFSYEHEFVHWGYPISYVEVPVNMGWNLIGSIYYPLSTDRVVTEPSSILLPGFHLYNPILRRYVQSSTVEPGSGYFVAALRDGVVKLGASYGFGKAIYDLESKWTATIEASSDYGGKLFVIGGASDNFYFPELPQIEPKSFPLYLMVENNAAYCSYLSDPGEWSFVNGVDTEFRLRVLNAAAGLFAIVNGNEIPLGEEPVTIPARTNFSILKKVALAPKEFYISSPYPNPFNSSTSVSLVLPEPVNVRLEVINSLGQRVKDIDYGELVGDVRLSWDGSSNSGELVSSGIYLLRIIAGKNEKIKPTLLIK